MTERPTLSAETATASDWLAALRASQGRLATLASGLDEAALLGPSYDTEWNVAEVLSHLGSSAEIFTAYLEAALDGTDAPGAEANQPVWDTWNARGPVECRDLSLAANETLTARLEGLSVAERDAFHLSLFGMELDLAGFVRMRLSEHAVHTWDIAVALDPTVTLTSDVVDLLVDGVDQVATWTAKPSPEPYTVRIDTENPSRALLIAVSDKTRIAPAAADDVTDGTVSMPAEAYFRLVYGRLDPDHAPPVSESGSRGLDDLRLVFQGL